MKKENIYIAGRMFNVAEINQRIADKIGLMGRFIDLDKNIEVEIFNPITDNPSNDKSTLPTAESIYGNDTAKVIQANQIFAELDGEDAGTMCEIGQALGINAVYEAFESFLSTRNDYEKEYGELRKALDMVKQLIPPKKIVAHTTDIRIANSGDYDNIRVPFGLNQFVVGGILRDKNGSIHTNIEDAYNKVLENTVKEN